ncbi:MAG: helix-turn-helix transcriptional regulator [Neptuniibacter sp.]
MRAIKLKSWNDAVTEVLKFGFSDESITNLIYELASLVDSKISTLILFTEGNKPYWPFKRQMSEREWKSLSIPYLDGAYLLDPFYHLAQKGSEGVFRLHDIVPDSFNETQFHHIYYEKIAVHDEMCAIFQLSEDVSALVSVCRVDSEKSYEPWAFDYFYSCFSILEISIKKWWNIKRQDTLSETPSLGPRLDDALDNFGASLLTPREREVARLSLEGHSVKAQALKLKLSSETVKSYKKNIYQKLDITSQAELFNLFIDSLKNYKPQNALDPLSGYL